MCSLTWPHARGLARNRDCQQTHRNCQFNGKMSNNRHKLLLQGQAEGGEGEGETACPGRRIMQSQPHNGYNCHGTTKGNGTNAGLGRLSGALSGCHCCRVSPCLFPLPYPAWPCISFFSSILIPLQSGRRICLPAAAKGEADTQPQCDSIRSVQPLQFLFLPPTHKSIFAKAI